MAISTVSFSKTPQAVDDRLQDATVVATSINVMGNDLGGNAKTLYSIDNGTSAVLNGGPADLLVKDKVGVVEYSALGAKIWINANGTVGYDPSTIPAANLPAAGTSKVDYFTYAIQMGDGTLSVATAKVWVGNAAPVVGNVSGTAVEDGAKSTLYALAFASDDFTPVSGLTVTAPSSLPAGVSYDATTKSFVLDPTVGAFQHLAAGATQNVSLNYTVTDSAGASVTASASWVVTGVNDLASISGGASGAVTEDGTLAAGGTLAVSDVDDGEATFAAVAAGALAGTYGSFTFSGGAWTYSLDNGAANVQALAAGETANDTLTVTSRDGTATQTIAVTITGTNDLASIGGDTAGGVTEDGTTTAGGTVSVSDVDHGENVFAAVDPSALAGSHGAFTFDAGAWTYTLDNGSADVQALAAGETMHDTLTVASVDGTATQTIDVTITGTNDLASISGNAAGAVTEDGTGSAGDTLAVSDVDHGEAVFAPVAAAALAGAFGTFTFDNGAWTYTLDNGAAGVQALAAGETAHDTLTVTSKDGTASQTIDVTITGTNDLASIAGGATGSVTEDGTLTAGGSLAVSDVDHGEATFAAVDPSSLHGVYGDFSFDSASGAWSYVLRNGDANVQALNTGDNPTETLTVWSKDGTASQDIVVTVHGVTDNLPVYYMVNHGQDTVNHRTTITGFDFNDVLKYAGDLTFTGKVTVSDVNGDGYLDTLVEFSYTSPGNGNGNGNPGGNGNGNGVGNNFENFEVVLLGYTGFDPLTQVVHA